MAICRAAFPVAPRVIQLTTPGRFAKGPEFWVRNTFVNPTDRVGSEEHRKLSCRLPARLSD
jgi:hypothetical protein